MLGSARRMTSAVDAPNASISSARERSAPL
jgi:hypothetical protein